MDYGFEDIAIDNKRKQPQRFRPQQRAKDKQSVEYDEEDEILNRSPHTRSSPVKEHPLPQESEFVNLDNDGTSQFTYPVNQGAKPALSDIVGRQ